MDDDVRNLIVQLHAHLEGAQQVDDETRDALRLILEDIQTVLHKPREAPSKEHHESFVERLRDATWGLEESHPKLTTAIAELVAALSRPFQ